MRYLKLERYGTAILLSIFVFVVLLATSPDIGLTWDEPAYMTAADAYMGWFQQALTKPAEAFSAEAITTAWKVNSEHPPLDKIWSGAVWSLARSFTDDLTAHRVGNMLLAALMAGLLYLWMRDAYGQAAGLAAVGALLSMPRFFFHAHLAALDVPAAFSVFVTTFAFWKTLERKHWAWGLVLGIVWGLALATKINAVFVPVTLGLWWLIFRRSFTIFWRLVIMGLTAIPVFLVVWPWLYVNTLDRLGAYIGFVTVNHWEIGQYYFGEFFMPPPWHFSFVMLWAVLPLGLTVLYAAGMARSGTGKRDHGLGWLLLLSALTPVLALAAGKSMVYDNERLLMVVFPFLAGLAGAGLGWLLAGCATLAARLGRPSLGRAAGVLLAVLAFAPQLASMLWLYPHYLSYYGESVGGLAGATRLGLETTYWCETYSLALPMINAQARPGDRIWADPWSQDVLMFYQRLGRLRDDLVILTPVDMPGARGFPMETADWLIVQHRQTTLGPEGVNSPILAVLNRKEAVYEYKYDGVAIFTLYK